MWTWNVRNKTMLLVAVALLLGAAPLLAQVADATIEATVADEKNMALPGVSVRVTGTETGRVRMAVTDSAGVARVAALPPGMYSVQFELAGFAPMVQEGVVLRVGQTQRLIVTMQPAREEEIVVTAAAPVVDVLKGDVSTNILPEQIEQLPVADRDFQKLAFLAPGVKRERGGYRFIGNAPLLGSSGNASETTIMVDGVDFTDQALGLARARFSQDAIREFRVITNRFDTEIGSSHGGALSVITKSGTNTTAGSVFGFYRADSLRSKAKFEQDKLDYSRYQAGFAIGGPIARDRTHYFLSFEYIDESNLTLFRPQGGFVGLAEDIDHPFDQTLLLASIDHSIGDSQRLQVKLVSDIYRETNFRVGGVADESSGMELNRDNWNLSLGHTWITGPSSLNTLHVQAGRKEFDEPNNSDAASEYFSLGNTLVSGANIVGDQNMKGDYLELRDSYHRYFSGAKSSHDLKLGGSVQWITEDWYYPVFPRGMRIYADDAGAWLVRYDYAVGEPSLKVDTTIYSLFIQDEWKASRNFTLSAGLRYDYGTDGNNPGFTHPLSPDKRSADDDNIQPRLGFVWDLRGDGHSVLRGGAGLFTGRYLLVPAFVEKQQNGVTGRTLYTRLDGLFVCVLYGIPPAFCPFPLLNPADPQNSGVPLAPHIALLQSNLEAPEATQASLGFTQRLGNSNLFLDAEAVYVEGDNEIIIRDTNFGGNSSPVRPNTTYAMINRYTNEGHSKYTSVMVSVNGTVGAGHLLSASVTWADKKNIADDFSPALNDYPSDPADIEAEYGRGRGDERWSAVLSGVFRLPWDVTVAPIFQYGSGQPWNRRLGYDFNGDGRYSDRAAGVKRNAEDGPDYKSFSLRLTKTVAFGGGGGLDIIIEGFNLFNSTNYDVNAIDSAEYRSGPTVGNASLPYVDNPNFGNYSATLPPREIQIGLRYRF